jgi:hypothetical protein
VIVLAGKSSASADEHAASVSRPRIKRFTDLSPR